MILTLTVITIFLISFLLLFIFIYRGEREELKEKKANLFHVFMAAFTLALIPTAVIALFIFVLHGSTTIVNFLFSLSISTNELIIIAISFCVYLLVVDGLVEVIVKLITNNNMSRYMLMMLIQILAFYVISLLVGLGQETSLRVAAGVALIIFLLEIVYDRMEKSKE